MAPKSTKLGGGAISRISRPTTQEAVTEALQEAILSGRLEPGEHLRQDAIAEQMGISRVPVREALNVLRAEGQLEYSPHRGYRVRSLSAEEVEEINLIRGMLEGVAIQRAVVGIDESVIGELEELNQQLREGHEVDDIIAFVRLNKDFHFRLFEQCGLPRLLQMIEGLWRVADGYRSGVFVDGSQRETMLEEHDALIDACRQGNGDLAVEIMDRHRNRAADTLLRLTDERAVND